MDDPFSNDFIARYRAGEEEAILALWEYGKKHYIPLLCSWGFSYADSQDIWYETHFNFFESKCPTFDPCIAPFGAWLRTVVKNVARYELRKRKHFPHEPFDDCEDLSSLRPGTQKEGGKSDLMLLVERAREELGKSHEIVIGLRFDEGLPFGLIAETLRISESAARMRVSRGLQQLRLISRGLNSGELPRRRKRIRRTNSRRTPPPERS